MSSRKSSPAFVGQRSNISGHSHGRQFTWGSALNESVDLSAIASSGANCPPLAVLQLQEQIVSCALSAIEAVDIQLRDCMQRQSSRNARSSWSRTWSLGWSQRLPAPLERPADKSPTAITHDFSALFVLSSVWQSPSSLEVIGNTGNMSSEKAGVGGSTPSLATTF
jgi:hypothetical protein